MSTDLPAGLCASCRHVRRIENRRRSTFFLCRRSRSDDRFPRYPRIPVRRCPGYEEDAGAEGSRDAASDRAGETKGDEASELAPGRSGDG